MIKRILESKLAAELSEYPVVTIFGPRQSGKTTLVRKSWTGCLSAGDRESFSVEVTSVAWVAV